MFMPSTVTASDSGLEPGALAGRAGHLPHVPLDLLALPVRLGLTVAPAEPGMTPS